MFTYFLRASKPWVGAALLSWSCLAVALTVAPRAATVGVGESQLVNVSSIKGTVSIENSKPMSVTVTNVGGSTYRIYGASAGVSTIKFKDAKSEVKVSVTVTGGTSSNPGALNGRLLASNCFQCHGTNGSGGFERLTGESASEIYGELKKFANGQEDSNGIMAAHAMGFSDAQLRAIANYFASLR